MRRPTPPKIWMRRRARTVGHFSRSPDCIPGSRPNPCVLAPFARLTRSTSTTPRNWACTIRQIARAHLKEETLFAESRPVPGLPPDSPFGRVQEEISTFGRQFWPVRRRHGVSRRRAGGDPTAVAVVSDLMLLAQNLSAGCGQEDVASYVSTPVLAAILRHRGICGFSCGDQPRNWWHGWAQILAAHHLNIDSLLQKPGFCPRAFAAVCDHLPGPCAIRYCIRLWKRCQDWSSRSDRACVCRSCARLPWEKISAGRRGNSARCDKPALAEVFQRESETGQRERLSDLVSLRLVRDFLVDEAGRPVVQSCPLSSPALD